MTSTFDILIDRVLDSEGGYVNDRRDPGGETQWGISKRSYPAIDIKALTRDGAKAIYKRDFWQVVHGDEMRPTLAFHALDFAVNSGPQTALRKLQAVLGVADDGWWGPVTRAAVAKVTTADMPLLLLGYTAERLHFISRLKNFKHHGAGWTARIAANLRFAIADLTQ